MKILVVAYNAFSKQNANGLTLKMLLDSFLPAQLMQFYCGTEFPDFDFCSSYFRATDFDILKSFVGRGGAGEIQKSTVSLATQVKQTTSKKRTWLTSFLKKNNYNYIFRSVREILWKFSPWGKKRMLSWVKKERPDAIFYMIGDNIFLDRLVLNISKKLCIPFVLYNAEAYRIVDERTRKGVERIFYKKLKKSYSKLASLASFTIYNCDYLRSYYEEKYKSKNGIVVYNSFQMRLVML